MKEETFTNGTASVSFEAKLFPKAGGGFVVNGTVAAAQLRAKVKALVSSANQGKFGHL